MWTDMSEIVRPTRDGIHGREYISTAVELGGKPRRLEFDRSGALLPHPSRLVRLPIPILFDVVPLANGRPAEVARAAAAKLDSYAFLPIELSARDGIPEGVAPRIAPAAVDELPASGRAYPLVELDRWDPAAYRKLKHELPESLVIVRLPLGASLIPLAEAGVEAIHLTADYHGQTDAGFAMQAIRTAHEQLVDLGCREQLSLIGSGGIVAAEHVPKAIISGLDAVALDTALLIALQAQFSGEFLRSGDSDPAVPEFEFDWGVQRICNLVASWRDQLLEVLGAMGLREVRRLRGEVGRAMMQDELELEAFGGIPGFGSQ